MVEAVTKREEILNVAESMIRVAGFNGFSTRDVANAVGIKSASVHYHFPTKADIGVAVTQAPRIERFIQGLGEPTAFLAADAEKALERYLAAFRRALDPRREAMPSAPCWGRRSVAFPRIVGLNA